MTDSQVSIVRCPSYASEDLRAAVGGGLSLLGGLERFFKARSRVFIKPNLLSPLSAPEDGVYTHPAFVGEVIRRLGEIGCDVVVGDDVLDDGGNAFRACGYEVLCRESGARLISVREAGFTEVPCQDGVLDHICVSRAALEADALVNLPKLKTHAFTGFTGAVKNSFGLIPHGSRMHLHRACRRVEDFGRALIDIHAALPPVLNIMDAVVGMEGLGPAAGRPRAIGLILASRDALALDTVAARLVGFDPEALPTTRAGTERGLRGSRLDGVEILGERLEAVEIGRFERPDAVAGFLGRRLPAAIYAFIQSRTGFNPRIDRRLCTGCGTCVKSCPVEAIAVRDGRASIDTGHCIRCLCCHEMCPSASVRLTPMFVRRAVGLAESALGRKKRRPHGDSGSA